MPVRQQILLEAEVAACPPREATDNSSATKRTWTGNFIAHLSVCNDVGNPCFGRFCSHGPLHSCQAKTWLWTVTFQCAKSDWSISIIYRPKFRKSADFADINFYQ